MNQNSPFFAFKYMFLDNKFWSKFAVFFLLVLACLAPQFIPETADKIGIINYLFLFIVLMVIGLFGQIFYYGYYCSCIKSIIEQSGNYVLPVFNFKKDGMLGLKCFAGMLLLGLAICFAFLILGIILGIAGSAIVAALYAVNPVIGVLIGAIIVLAVIFAVTAVAYIYYPSALRLFAQIQDPLVFFNFKEIFRLIKENKDIYYKYIGIMVLATLLVFAVVLTICIPCIALKICSPVICVIVLCTTLAFAGAYVNLVCAYATAKCIR